MFCDNCSEFLGYDMKGISILLHFDIGNYDLFVKKSNNKMTGTGNTRGKLRTRVEDGTGCHRV